MTHTDDGGVPDPADQGSAPDSETSPPVAAPAMQTDSSLIVEGVKGSDTRPEHAAVLGSEHERR